MAHSHIEEYAPFWFWGGWQVDRPVGEGSFGQVYRLVHQEDGHEEGAVVKIMSIPNANQIEMGKTHGIDDFENQKAFFEKLVETVEADLRKLHSLSGQLNILSYQDLLVVRQYRDFGWDILIRMEEAISLSAFLSSHQTRIGDAVWLGMDLCTTLDECLTYGVTHGNIKESNIFFTSDGYCRLGDVGLAKQLALSDPKTFLEASKAYLAPERVRQLRDDGRHFPQFEISDTATDIYSLGMVMYKMFNHGRLPFMPPYPEPVREGDEQAAIERRLEGALLPKPAEANEDLGRIILKACAPHAKNRHTSVHAMKNDLEKVMQSLSAAQRDHVLTLDTSAKPDERTKPGGVLLSWVEENPVEEKSSQTAKKVSSEPLSTARPVHIKATSGESRLAFDEDDANDSDRKKRVLWVIVTSILVVCLLIIVSLMIIPDWPGKLLARFFEGKENNAGASTQPSTATTLTLPPTPAPTTAPVAIATTAPSPTSAVTIMTTMLSMATPTPMPTTVRTSEDTQSTTTKTTATTKTTTKTTTSTTTEATTEATTDSTTSATTESTTAATTGETTSAISEATPEATTESTTAPDAP